MKPTGGGERSGRRPAALQGQLLNEPPGRPARRCRRLGDSASPKPGRTAALKKRGARPFPRPHLPGPLRCDTCSFLRRLLYFPALVSENLLMGPTVCAQDVRSLHRSKGRIRREPCAFVWTKPDPPGSLHFLKTTGAALAGAAQWWERQPRTEGPMPGPAYVPGLRGHSLPGQAGAEAAGRGPPRPARSLPAPRGALPAVNATKAERKQSESRDWHRFLVRSAARNRFRVPRKSKYESHCRAEQRPEEVQARRARPWDWGPPLAPGPGTRRTALCAGKWTSVRPWEPRGPRGACGSLR